MICTFYNTNDSVNKINKTLRNSEQTTCDIINMTDIINPSIIVDGRYINKNYVYINDLHRYYFVKNVTISNNMIIMQLEIDTLYTYKTEILNSTQYIVRCEDYHFTELQDTSVAVKSNVILNCEKVSEDFITKNFSYVLGVR